MTVRLRVTFEDKVREYAFDRATVSVGRGPFNDIVVAEASLGRVHGELEVRDDGLVFRTRASSTPTSIFRDGECTQSTDGETEDTLHFHAGDVVRMGEQPSVALEVVEVVRRPERNWATHAMPTGADASPSDTTGKLLFRLTRGIAYEPNIETFLRTCALFVGYVCDRMPDCIELSIPIEASPWRSDDHLLQAVSMDLDRPAEELSPVDVDGGYLQTRDPLPPFGPDAAAILDELRGLDCCVVVDDRGAEASVLVPFDYDGELAAVLDLSFPQGKVDELMEAVALAGALLKPIAAIVLGRDRQWRVYEGVVEENHYWRERQRRRYHFKDLIAESDSMREVYEKLNDFVGLDSPVLLHGEAGTGKALVARALHHMGPRKDAMLTSINCRELASDTLDFELFGSVANELSGDVEPRKGIFELAEGGTVFLEEVDQMSLLLQGKVLRMLREGELRRIGDAVARRVDVRVVASTHRDLSALVSQGRFRRDLYLVLSEHVLELPALSERQEDILPLARTFLRKFAARYDRPCRRICEPVQQKLRDHRWQGNVRELQAVIEAAVLKCDGEEVGVDDVAL
ncbi:AAA family ATPase [Persicimonas caeni]|uniref:AAA family ATPase n=1 Tax=Persicimonas caeni TaxID=2292766 RepID=A0A4Y6PZG0_PERCE|nr:sigma 54-interacting transcriptional regulator [Persicimonas caeni]QDG53135.1 AAA family ATPase [Persicimonas caeni]QED34357.1 AAA family ATPase [Persicimonas caeni]